MCVKEIIMQCKVLFDYIQNARYLPPVQKVHILACSWHVSMTHALHCMHKCSLQLCT